MSEEESWKRVRDYLGEIVPFFKSVVIYLMNHRSNSDYILVAYVMMGNVSISYAVGEWARAFPLE
ncbi:MAG: hypothetical protein ABI120_12065 [Gemmatimonadaceae bacterium]